MKTVTGKIISSKPVPISKAASILSNFVSTETGASPAICAYLRRATVAFDELARLHPKSNNKQHKNQKSDAEESPSRAGLTHGVLDERRKNKEDKTVNKVKEEKSEAETERKKKKKKEKYGFGNPAEDEGKMVIEVKGEQSNLPKKKKKKEKEEEEEERDYDFGNSAENRGEVVNKSSECLGKVEIEEKVGGTIGIAEEKLDESNKKKRKKNRDVEEEMKDGLQEQHSKKKKKKRKRDSGEVDD